jgi:hypothetical protein
MPEIISAKCFACGHVVKVPVALAGKKARCPKCTNTITIPSRPDGMEDVVGDEMLPEVARDGDPIEEDDEEADAEPASPPAERIRPQTGVRRTSSTSNPRMSSTANPRMGGRAAQGRRGGASPAPKKQNNAMVIGIVVGVVVLVALIAMAASNSSKQKTKSSSTATKPAVQPDVDSEDSGLEQQCRAYIGAVNAGVDRNIMKYYSYDADGERAVRRAVSGLIENSTRYDGVTFKSVSAATGMVTFSFTGGERTVAWKKVDGTWLILER